MKRPSHGAPVELGPLTVAATAWTAAKAIAFPAARTGARVDDVDHDVYAAFFAGCAHRLGELGDLDEFNHGATHAAITRAVRRAQLGALQHVLRAYVEHRHEWAWRVPNTTQPFRDAGLAFCAAALDQLEAPKAADDLMLSPPAPGATCAVRALVEDATLAELAASVGTVSMPESFVLELRYGAPADVTEPPHAPFLHVLAACLSRGLANGRPLRALLPNAIGGDAGDLEPPEIARRVEARFGPLRASLASADDVSLDFESEIAGSAGYVRRTAAVIAATRGVPAAAMRHILGRMGEVRRPIALLETEPAEQADAFVVLRARVRVADAAARLDVGDLVGARAVLGKTHERLYRSALSSGGASASETRARLTAAAALLVDEAAIDRLEMRHADAAERCMRAADLVRFDGATRAGHLGASAEALLADATTFHHGASLDTAVGRLTEALALRSRAADPLAWAQTEAALAGALLAQGAAHDDGAEVTDAVRAYQTALAAYPRAADPTGWARVQHQLGVALVHLAEHDVPRVEGVARYEAAAAALRAAMEERTRDRAPAKWAESQYGLAAALFGLARLATDLEPGCGGPRAAFSAFARSPAGLRRLTEARDAYAAALAELMATDPAAAARVRTVVAQIDDVLEFGRR